MSFSGSTSRSSFRPRDKRVPQRNSQPTFQKGRRGQNILAGAIFAATSGVTCHDHEGTEKLKYTRNHKFDGDATIYLSWQYKINASGGARTGVMKPMRSTLRLPQQPMAVMTWYGSGASDHPSKWKDLVPDFTYASDHQLRVTQEGERPIYLDIKGAKKDAHLVRFAVKRDLIDEMTTAPFDFDCHSEHFDGMIKTFRAETKCDGPFLFIPTSAHVETIQAVAQQYDNSILVFDNWASSLKDVAPGRTLVFMKCADNSHKLCQVNRDGATVALYTTQSAKENGFGVPTIKGTYVWMQPEIRQGQYFKLDRHENAPHTRSPKLIREAVSPAAVRARPLFKTRESSPSSVQNSRGRRRTRSGLSKAQRAAARAHDQQVDTYTDGLGAYATPLPEAEATELNEEDLKRIDTHQEEQDEQLEGFLAGHLHHDSWGIEPKSYTNIQQDDNSLTIGVVLKEGETLITVVVAAVRGESGLYLVAGNHDTENPEFEWSDKFSSIKIGDDHAAATNQHQPFDYHQLTYVPLENSVFKDFTPTPHR
jgi:cytochrome c553